MSNAPTLFVPDPDDGKFYPGKVRLIDDGKKAPHARLYRYAGAGALAELAAPGMRNYS